jgi:haloalkane dehalogenase
MYTRSQLNVRAGWLGTSNVPKLLLKAEPGAILANDRLANLVRGSAPDREDSGGDPFRSGRFTRRNRKGFVDWMRKLG